MGHARPDAWRPEWTAPPAPARRPAAAPWRPIWPGHALRSVPGYAKPRPGAKTTAEWPAGLVPHPKSSKSAPWGYNGLPTAMAVQFFMQPTRDFRTCLWAGESGHPLGPLGGPWAIRVPPYKRTWKHPNRPLASGSGVRSANQSRGWGQGCPWGCRVPEALGGRGRIWSNFYQCGSRLVTPQQIPTRRFCAGPLAPGLLVVRGRRGTEV